MELSRRASRNMRHELKDLGSNFMSLRVAYCTRWRRQRVFKVYGIFWESNNGLFTFALLKQNRVISPNLQKYGELHKVNISFMQ
jgi:hypothetical protein